LLENIGDEHDNVEKKMNENGFMANGKNDVWIWMVILKHKKTSRY
jgi:hypothetical protein